ncbi:MAG TPA: MerR family transcriptional regulator [Thermoanaerobaculia bacterium]|jgi:methanogenic corrinoid protein MtbC1|nr:MerR family transcriptional regulator [Thermoanaerobaculia bacterium]
MDARSNPAPVAERLFSIGAVARATGLSPDTLRVWQKRYGFPLPQRKGSGHRLYSPEDVRRLRRIAEALARGHRPGQVVALSGPRLESLLLEPSSRASSAAPAAPLAGLMSLVRDHAGTELGAALLAEAGRLGPLAYLRDCVAPLIEAVGDAWSRGELGIAHEHFFSERLSDVLRSLRLPFERSPGGARLVLAAFPGETHGLGLQVAAFLAATAGLEPHVLGADTPLAEIVAAVRARRPAAVGISISVSTGGAASRERLSELRHAVPGAIPVLVGGAGARRSRPPGGCVIVDDLESAQAWMRRLAAA